MPNRSKLTPQMINLREVKRKNEFNEKFPVGTTVRAVVNGKPTELPTASESWINGKGKAVVHLLGFSYAVDLDDITPPSSARPVIV